MSELLESKKDILIETLCHPLCDCSKCQSIKLGSQRSSRLGSTDSEVELGNQPRISSTSRDENGWTALHAAAFYGEVIFITCLILSWYVTSESLKIWAGRNLLPCKSFLNNLTLQDISTVLSNGLSPIDVLLLQHLSWEICIHQLKYRSKFISLLVHSSKN